MNFWKLFTENDGPYTVKSHPQMMEKLFESIHAVMRDREMFLILTENIDIRVFRVQCFQLQSLSYSLINVYIYYQKSILEQIYDLFGVQKSRR